MALNSIRHKTSIKILNCNVLILIDCPDKALSDLRSDSDLTSNGWDIDSEKQNTGGDDMCRSTNTWYGFTSGSGIASIATTFKGKGEATLSFGNCHSIGYVRATLNGNSIGQANAGERKDVSFEYSIGDVLKIEEVNTAIIKIWSIAFKCTKIAGNFL